MTVLSRRHGSYFRLDKIPTPHSENGKYQEIHRLTLIALRSIFEHAISHQEYKVPDDISYFAYPTLVDQESSDVLWLYKVLCRSKQRVEQIYYVAIAMSEPDGNGSPCFKGISHPCNDTGGVHPDIAFLRDPTTWYIWL